jgi:hypothetical protein
MGKKPMRTGIDLKLNRSTPSDSELKAGSQSIEEGNW